MHNRSQRDPKKSIWKHQQTIGSNRIGEDYFRLQQATFEENQSLMLKFMYELPKRKTCLYQTRKGGSMMDEYRGIDLCHPPCPVGLEEDYLGISAELSYRLSRASIVTHRPSVYLHL